MPSRRLLTITTLLAACVSPPPVTTPPETPPSPAPPVYQRMTTKWQGPGLCLDVVNDGVRNDRLRLAPCADASGQLWRATPEGASVRLTTKWRGDDVCLQSSPQLRMVPCAASATQRWTLAPTKQTSFVRLKAGDDRCLDVINDGAQNDQLHVTACANTSGQMWRMASASAPLPPPPPPAPTACQGVDTRALKFAMKPRPTPTPPFVGTVYVTPKILTDRDPTAYRSMRYRGVGARKMYDRRIGAFATFQAHLFDARLGASKTIEVQVNTEFSKAQATAHAKRYLPVIGRSPAFLLRDVDTVWIHGGNKPFGGGNRNLLIHTLQGDDYIRRGVLEEAFLHEGAHTSMDARFGQDPRWRCAQALDRGFVSPYAKQNPGREDLAETLTLYLALRHRPTSLTPKQRATLSALAPNRIAFFDALGLTMELVK